MCILSQWDLRVFPAHCHSRGFADSVRFFQATPSSTSSTKPSLIAGPWLNFLLVTPRYSPAVLRGCQSHTGGSSSIGKPRNNTGSMCKMAKHIRSSRSFLPNPNATSRWAAACYLFNIESFKMPSEREMGSERPRKMKGQASELQTRWMW
ncbi:uncharacterized protein LOC117088633 [Trachypithecus francoisi]|uniref:uncharacterized protein LOC117088633 n=1 Tax=Trachypithecus francoisi TaxID=54180 RepID=UPI00141A8019|nr:uncharacterized protein LOC117088633 [Trachypithecus francoisi]